ncbi:MAG: carboxypeptidase regulatory-like domain-containing protein [Deltaproteobacteria bacterium]|nr:carboxypeptidase regulatory-like domain-containing protein [Deltaproteobacteria bacterium]
MGRVYAAGTERGIGGALVRVRPTYGEPKLLSADSEGWLGFTTQADGTYALVGIPPGNWEVEAIAVGYLPNRGEFRKFSAVEDDEGFDFALDRAGTIEGRVIDTAGRAVPKARVGLLISHGVLAPSPVAVTGEDGQFVLDPVPAEELQVHVEAPGHSPKTVDVEGATEPVRRVEIRLSTGRRLAGVVKDAFGPVAGARVLLEFSDSEEGRFFAARLDEEDTPAVPRGVLTDANGAFSLETPSPSRVVLSAEAKGYRRARHRHQVIEGKDTPVEILLEPSATLSGRVLSADGRPASRAVVEVTSDRTALARAETDGEGRFSVDGLERTGPWQVTVTHHEHPVFEIEETDLSGEHTYRLEPSGRILGWIRNARTHAPVTKYGYQLTGPLSSSGGAVSLSGSFELGELLGGAYTVRISADGYLEGKVENVLVTQGQTTSDVIIELEPGASIAGRVLGAEGSYHVFATLNGAVAAASGTDESGEFRLAPLAAGVYTVRAANEFGISSLDGVQVAAGAAVSGLTLEAPAEPAAP